MIYKVLINFNDKRNKPLNVADSVEEFNKTTVRELKEKFCSLYGGVDPDDIRVIFGKDQLEDNQTLAYYKTEHLSVLFIVLKMPGGGGPLPKDKDDGFHRSDSMERLHFHM